MSKKILIIGNGAKEYALAKKLSEKHEVYVTPSSDTLKEFTNCLDIREDNVAELLEFVMENGIDMTIPISAQALNQISQKYLIITAKKSLHRLRKLLILCLIKLLQRKFCINLEFQHQNLVFLKNKIWFLIILKIKKYHFC